MAKTRFFIGLFSHCTKFNLPIFGYYYKDLFTYKDINTYINGVIKICLNKLFLKMQVSKRKEKKICKIMHK